MKLSARSKLKLKHPNGKIKIPPTFPHPFLKWENQDGNISFLTICLQDLFSWSYFVGLRINVPTFLCEFLSNKSVCQVRFANSGFTAQKYFNRMATWPDELCDLILKILRTKYCLAGLNCRSFASDLRDSFLCHRLVYGTICNQS